MSLAFIRFFESLPSALVVGLLLLPRLIDEDGARFKPAVALLASVRFLLGFLLLVVTARVIIPAERPLDFSTVWVFTFGTVVGKAWVATQFIAFAFAALAVARLFIQSDWLDRVTLWTAMAVLAIVSVTGHAIDDGLPAWTQLSFLLHTAAGLTWLGGLLGLVWWMWTGRDKPPELAYKLADRWSVVAKVAMAIVALSGLALAWENVASFPNLLATPYGRLLTFKLVLLCAVLALALALARYITRPETKIAFDTQWYSKVGAGEAAFGVALLFIAGWIAVITPASHENNLYWPLPFRLSYIATWGQKTPMFSPIWWWGVGALALAVVAAMVWFTPAARAHRRIATSATGIASLLCLLVSFSTQAYTDTYDDPTQDYTSESVARGLGHFQAYCTGCHGPTGEGNGPMAKDLKVPPADLTAPHVGTHTIGDIFHWLTFGGQSGFMPSFRDQLDVDDRWDVINYLLMLSYSNRSRFMSPQGMIQWLIAPDFTLVDPEEKANTLFKLRGVPTLVSFARCAEAGGADKELAASLVMAAETARAAGANHVTIYTGDCPAQAKGREPTHPKAVETAYSVINRYPNETPSVEIAEAHFLVDRSGFVRARFRRFAADDGNSAQLAAQIAMMAKEPIVTINLHSH